MHGHLEVYGQFVESLFVESAVNEQCMHEFHLSASAICICTDYEVVAGVFMHSADISLTLNDMLSNWRCLMIEGDGERGDDALDIANSLSNLVSGFL